MATLSLVALAAFVGGFIQGLTGFGAGIVLMLVLPMLFDVISASSISQAVCLTLTFSTALLYRAHIRRDLLFAPVALFVATSCTTLLFAKGADQAVMKFALGVFLTLLALYFLALNKGGRVELSRGAELACIVVSGVCDGMFGIGGPLMVVYYLAKIEDTHEYLGTIQAFFACCSSFTLAFRIIQGTIAISSVPLIAFGAAAIVSGALLASRLLLRLDADSVRKLTYIVIGLAGVYNALAAAL